MRAVCSALVLVALPLGVRAQSEVVLRPSDSEPGLYFGAAVSLDGTGLLVGATGSSGGRAYVFRSTPAGWVEEAKLALPDGTASDMEVALAGDLAFVGVPDYVNGSGQKSGGVFLFERSGTTWGSAIELLPVETASTFGFGHELAAEPARLVVASNRGAHVFEPVAGTWTENTLFPVTLIRSVDLSGDRVVLGRSYQVLVFEHSGSVWDAGTELDGSHYATFGPYGPSAFGTHVAIEGDRVVAPGPPVCLPGILHGFELRAGEWRKSLVNEDLGFTEAAEMNRGRLALAYSSASTAAIYRSLPSGGWIAAEQHTAPVPWSYPDPSGGIGLSGNLVAFGAPWDDTGGDNSGSVWVWELEPLSALPENMSVNSGGTQELELLRGLHDGFSVYWIFGSATGTSPGQLVDGLTFPLNFDGYYFFLLLNPNTVVNPTIGFLDASGRATSQIAFPAFDPQLIGTTLNHAYLTFDLSGVPFVDFVSNAVPLRLFAESELPPEDFETNASGWLLGIDGMGQGAWELVAGGECGAVTGMAAFTTPAPDCGGSLTEVMNARLTSAPFRLGRTGDYELRLKSRLTPGLEPSVRMFVDGMPAAYFEVAWPEDFADTSVLESLSFPVPGVEFAVGRETTFEFLLNGTPSGGSPAGWWIDDVELVKLP